MADEFDSRLVRAAGCALVILDPGAGRSCWAGRGPGFPLNWSYSEGERAGALQKFSRR